MRPSRDDVARFVAGHLHAPRIRPVGAAQRRAVRRQRQIDPRLAGDVALQRRARRPAAPTFRCSTSRPLPATRRSGRQRIDRQVARRPAQTLASRDVEHRPPGDRADRLAVTSNAGCRSVAAQRRHDLRRSRSIVELVGRGLEVDVRVRRCRCRRSCRPTRSDVSSVRSEMFSRRTPSSCRRIDAGERVQRRDRDRGRTERHVRDARPSVRPRCSHADRASSRSIRDGDVRRRGRPDGCLELERCRR